MGCVGVVRWLAWVVAGVTAGLLVVPIVVVVILSFSSGQYLQFPPPGWSVQWYERFLGDPSWMAAARQSLVVATLTTVITTPLGVMAARALTSWKGRGSGALTTVVMMPLIVPVIIFAIGAYAVFLQLRVTGTTAGLVAAHIVLALPFVVIITMAPLRTVDRDLERAAASLGASPITAFRSVVLPIIAPGVMASALFVFITSFDEVVAAIFLTSPTSQTLPVKMWSTIRLDVDPTIAAPASILVIGSTIVLAITGLLRRRSTSWR